ncbi:hypothetical protein [uncultured Dokdonia sp.]|uniref:hypothetical protein n=1 Tax=uncultured Dokdonia sp. TaxID=575653 RepID=UPI002605A1C9|nr:hypothetical protein [uncultured Dokdonia sp.]
MKSTSTVPAGTEVSYAKVINPAYAKDYIGADIITEVQFYTPGASNAWQTKIPKNHIVFQVIPIGGSAKDAPFGGGALGDYVFVPKSQGDLIFNLQQGDRIQLRGGTRIRKAYIGGVELIEFIATSVTKL